jgi:hypothetical protein
MAELPEGTQMRRDETGVVRSVLLPRQRRHRGSARFRAKARALQKEIKL